MALVEVGSFALGELNNALSAALGFLAPLTAELDLYVTGAFGLGALMAELQAQYSAAIQAEASLSLQVTNPLAAVQAAITAFGQLAAALQAALALGVPTLGVQLGAQVTAAAALAGSLQAKLGGIRALITGSLDLKLRALNLLAGLEGSLSAGPIAVLSFEGEALREVGAEVAVRFSTALGSSAPILPSDPVSGVLLVTRDPAVFAALSALVRTA